MKSTEPNPIRQAAVFFRSLAPEAAATMLARLSPEEASRLRQAIRTLGDVEDSEREAVVLAAAGSEDSNEPSAGEAPAAPQRIDEGGVELMLSQPAPAVTPPAAEPRPRRRNFEQIEGDQWLDSLSDAEPEAVAGFLSREQPQAIALVLSRLPDALAAAVLAEFDADHRAAVLLQLSRTGEADPGAVRVIATELANWINQHRDLRRQKAERVAKIEAIVAALPEHDRAAVVEQLTEADDDLAGALKRHLPAPEPTPDTLPEAAAAEPSRPVAELPPAEPLAAVVTRLERVPAKQLLAAGLRLPPRQALLAFAELPDKVLHELTRVLPRKAALDLRRRLAQAAPVRLRDVEASQRALDAILSRSNRSTSPR